MNKTNQQTLPQTRNEAWGFWGTINPAIVEKAWPLALITISETTDTRPEGVRAFLDSCYGRYFADTVNDYLYTGLDMAIKISAQEWQNDKIGRADSIKLGVKRGSPFLTSVVKWYEKNDADQ